MSDQEVMTVNKQASVASVRAKIPPKRKRNLILLSAFFLLSALAFSLLYLFVWQYEEETDDAYVSGHLVQITAQIGGTVQSVSVEDTQHVKAGQRLLSLETDDNQLAYEQAKNALINAIRQNQQQMANRSQADAQVNANRVLLVKAQDDLRRRQRLAGTDAISAEELSHARAAVTQAQAVLVAAQAQEQSARAVLGEGLALREQPAVLTAISHVKQAWLNLQRTEIRAPMDGQIAKRNVQLGQRIAPGSPLMVLVPLHNLWVDANFKEAQLRQMRIGQRADVHADIYGKQVTYSGKVVGFSAGTGSAFSLLPPQNATGNWIKVVQRVPVRIELESSQLEQYPLRVGLSMQVVVHTDQQAGDQLAPAQNLKTSEVEHSTDWAEVDQVIDSIFTQYAQ